MIGFRVARLRGGSLDPSLVAFVLEVEQLGLIDGHEGFVTLLDGDFEGRKGDDRVRGGVGGGADGGDRHGARVGGVGGRGAAGQAGGQENVAGFPPRGFGVVLLNSNSNGTVGQRVDCETEIGVGRGVAFGRVEQELVRGIGGGGGERGSVSVGGDLVAMPTAEPGLCAGPEFCLVDGVGGVEEEGYEEGEEEHDCGGNVSTLFDRFSGRGREGCGW